MNDKYPRLNYHKRHWLGHRLSYHLNVEKIPRKAATGTVLGGVAEWKSKQILHKCNNKWCINYKHLYKGMHKENSIDRWKLVTEEEKAKFKIKMRKICSSKKYREYMKLATIGILKTKLHKQKIGAAHKKLWANPDYHAKMCLAFKMGWKNKNQIRI